MRKNSGSIGNSGAYTSPGTPEYGDNYGRGVSKGWSSERVPLPTNSCRRHISAAALMPFNSGRALPSKWDDAERWITSPLSGYGVLKTSAAVQPERRPKSKSGPLGTAAGVMHLPGYSPAASALEVGSGRNYMAGSPFTTGVLVPDGLSIHYGGAGRNGALSNSFVYTENSTAQSSSVHGFSHFQCESSLSNSQDDKLDSYKEVERTVSRRDMATQMSPQGSSHSSPKGRASFSTLPLPIPTAADQQSNYSAKVEVRDVQVDKGATVTRQSKKHGLRKTRKESSDFQELASQWDVSGHARTPSKLQSEEAKITAWENLQKAKAEAAIQKLKMKLEKKRSAAMDKILNKLRASQTKAQDMRRSITENQPRGSSSITHRPFFLKYAKTGSLRDCFFCCTR